MYIIKKTQFPIDIGQCNVGHIYGRSHINFEHTAIGMRYACSTMEGDTVVYLNSLHD